MAWVQRDVGLGRGTWVDGPWDTMYVWDMGLVWFGLVRERRHAGSVSVHALHCAALRWIAL